MKYIEASDLVFNDIQEAFTLMKEDGTYKHDCVNLDRAVIVTGLLSELSVFDWIMGMPVVVCDLQTSYDYFLTIHEPSRDEEVFLRCHRQAMEA